MFILYQIENTVHCKMTGILCTTQTKKKNCQLNFDLSFWLRDKWRDKKHKEVNTKDKKKNVKAIIQKIQKRPKTSPINSFY